MVRSLGRGASKGIDSHNVPRKSAVKPNEIQYGRVILGCAEDSLDLLSSAAREIQPAGHAVDLVSGIDLDAALFTRAIARHQARGIYVICKSEELDDYQVRRLQGIAKQAGVESGRVLIVRKSQGMRDIVQRVLGRLSPGSRPTIRAGGANRLPGPGTGAVSTSALPVSPASPASPASPPPLRSGPPVRARSSPGPKAAGLRPPTPQSSAVQPPAAPPAAAPPAAAPPTAAPPAAPSPVGEEDELPTNSFLVPEDDPAGSLLEVDVDSETSQVSFTPVGRLLAFFKGRPARWATAAGGGAVLLTGAMAAAVCTPDEAQEADADAEVAAAMVASDPVPTAAAVKQSPEPAPAVGTEAQPEPESEPKPEPESEPEPEPEIELDEAPSAETAQIDKALRRRKIRSLDILLFQPKKSRKRYRYEQAVAYCAGRNIQGISGWRLPAIGELSSLASSGMLRRDYYWSGTAADTFAQRRLVIKSNTRKIMSRATRWRGARAQCVRTRDGAPSHVDPGEG